MTSLPSLPYACMDEGVARARLTNTGGDTIPFCCMLVQRALILQQLPVWQARGIPTLAASSCQVCMNLPARLLTAAFCSMNAGENHLVESGDLFVQGG